MSPHAISSRLITALSSRLGFLKIHRPKRQVDKAPPVLLPLNPNDIGTQIIVNSHNGLTTIDLNSDADDENDFQLSPERFNKRGLLQRYTGAFFSNMALLCCLGAMGVSAFRLNSLLTNKGFNPISTPANDGTEVGALDPAHIKLLRDKIDPLSELNSLPDLINFAKPSVVRIHYKNEIGFGSGFIYDSNGLIITNHHVIEDSGNNGGIKVILYDGTQTTGTVIAFDKTLDIALVKIYLKELPALELSQDEIKPGEKVVVLGSPCTLGWSASSGIISATKRHLDETRGEFLQTDAAINPGNSGGPILNTKGQVVGIVLSTIINLDNLGFGRSAAQIQSFVNEVKNNNEELFTE